jgi:hypothetical protein
MNVITFGPDTRRHVLKEFAQSEQQDRDRSLLSDTDTARDRTKRRERHERLSRWRQRTRVGTPCSFHGGLVLARLTLQVSNYR